VQGPRYFLFSQLTEEKAMYGHIYGALISRVGLGMVLVAHSVYLKGIVYTLPGTAGYFASIGLPGTLAYLVFAVEAVAGVALIVGYKVRLASLAVVPVLLGASWAHLANGWLFTNAGGGWEYPLFLATVAVAQIFLGAGSYAVDNRSDNDRHHMIDADVDPVLE
jgi:putative oxidoreductase